MSRRRFVFHHSLLLDLLFIAGAKTSLSQSRQVTKVLPAFARYGSSRVESLGGIRAYLDQDLISFPSEPPTLELASSYPPARMSKQEGSFGILGSSKLNTVDGKNPPKSSETSKSTLGMASGGMSNQNKQEGYRQECQRAHDEMESRLKDEELQGRSRGWSD